ncbi:DUF4380 domain-containing protein [Microbulbifer sp.]|uniref:DUF4380 domain-containing protein n=1 Tax=Microbulbifer sp. TaxID=1908541 RepID=UPI00258EEC32|nr:DUF4380 domain-containing protein [Microbulbifer sp.]
MKEVLTRKQGVLESVLAGLLMAGLLSGNVQHAGAAESRSAAPETEASHEVEPVQLVKGPLSIAVSPQYGGRITGLSLNGRNLLTQNATDGNNFGSTFWLSPQSLWNWPPVAAHDSAPYRITAQDAHTLSMQGPTGAGARVGKSISMLTGNRARVKYRIEAEQDFDEIAAWEITRVPSRGLAFAPVKMETVQTVRGSMQYLQDAAGVLWLPMDKRAQHKEGKIIANGSEGWLAYAVDGLLYLKVYPKIEAEEMATGEGDIELYLSGVKPYLELEVQSAAQVLTRDEVLDWSVEWLLLPIPDDVEVRSGSRSLLDFAREQVSAL